MVRTVQSIVDEARTHVQDIRPEGYRYPDTDFILYANSALNEIRRLRPDFFVGTFGDAMPIITAIGDDWPLESQTELPVVYFMAGSAMLRDDEFANDGRAVSMLKTFRQLLTGDAGEDDRDR